ncbi:hypothetical protein CBR_g60598 [Chara braunii]|uniref:Sugar phosphate transporter domain-containing protein n=1 Tax=Chara braunii TaxID=69332 RepID=A0A388MF73_CHABU|nr:hypothetical protein CBR_g60598 [Chara braunii]|eukprot:GBG93210.1 hypothetical protein CBR_g60598 [Chara braunii]
MAQAQGIRTSLQLSGSGQGERGDTVIQIGGCTSSNDATVGVARAGAQTAVRSSSADLPTPSLSMSSLGSSFVPAKLGRFPMSSPSLSSTSAFMPSSPFLGAAGLSGMSGETGGHRIGGAAAAAAGAGDFGGGAGLVRGGGGGGGLVSLSYGTTRDRALAAIFYGLISISITLFNRAVFAVYRFNFPLTVTTIQILISIFLIFCLQSLNMVEKTKIRLCTMKKIFPLTVCWWLYVVSGVTALRYLNVPMYSVLRRSTTLVVMLGELVVFQKKPSVSSVSSIVTITAGAAIAGFTDLTFSLKGYLCVLVCVLTTAAYLILIRILKDKAGLSEMGMMYYNNCLSLPIMLFCLHLSDEITGVLSFPRLLEPRFLAFLLVSSSQGFLLNVAIFRCTTVNSPLTTSVTGQVKDIATTLLGFFLFGDVIPGKLNTLGVIIGLVGGLWYSAEMYLQRFRNARKGEAAKSWKIADKLAYWSGTKLGLGRSINRIMEDARQRLKARWSSRLGGSRTGQATSEED